MTEPIEDSIEEPIIGILWSDFKEEETKEQEYTAADYYDDYADDDWGMEDL